MAVLEFEFKGIDQNFRSSASNVLNDIDKIKKAFGSIGVGIGVDLKTALDGQKVALNDTKIQTQELVKAGKELDNQNKQTRNSIAELTLEQKKLTAEQRASRANLQDSPYSRLSRELNEMRNEAKNLGAEMLKLSMKGDTTSKEYLKLEQAFNKVQSKITPLDSSLKKLDSSLGQNQRRVGAYGNALGGFESAQGSANGVAMEFTRIIQDAPYGMMGIGNNIQQLTSNFGAYRDQLAQVAAQQGKTLTSMQMFQGIATSFLSTGNLISLAVAGITSAWTFYTMQQQKANKATEEATKSRKNAKDSLDAYVESMSSLTGALLKGEQSAEKELIRLRLLNDTYKNSNASVQQRKNAYNEMISMYESYFGKLTDEQKKVFDLGKHYDQLTNAIIKTAKARALEDEMVENAKKLRALDKQRNTEVNNYNKLQQAQNDKQLTYADALLGKLGEENKALAKIGLVRQLTLTGQEDNLKEQAKINEAVNKWVITSGKIADINKDNEDIYKQINEIVSQGAVISTNFGNVTKNTTKSLKDQRDYLLEIQQILQNSQSRVDTSGEILNWDKELIKVHDYYDSQNLALDKMLVSSQRAYKDDSAKRQQIEQAINSTRITLHNNMINELSKIDDKYFSEGIAKVAELNAKYSDSMDLDTRSNALKKVRDEFAKLREEFKNDPIISQEMLDKWQENQTLKVNWEFDNKDLEEWGKLNDRIQETIDKPFNGKNTRSIQSELEKRIDIIKRLLEQLSRATGQPFDQAEFDRLSTELKTKSTEKYNLEQAKKDIQDYVSIANNGLNSVFTNLKGNIDEFGLKTRSVFYTLGETLGDLIKQLANKNTAKFMESITKDAKSFSDLKDNWKNMSSQDKWSVGLGFAGGAVSGLTPQTSSGGQAIGGALSGAAAGASIGGVYGAAIGAVVGGVSGLLKAAKNRRQEKILLQQYEEQKKANALLERMNALTYASQIIGQKTEYGIVSGVRRNEFGQIVSVVQGQDIIMVADRANQQKGR